MMMMMMIIIVIIIIIIIIIILLHVFKLHSWETPSLFLDLFKGVLFLKKKTTTTTTIVTLGRAFFSSGFQST